MGGKPCELSLFLSRLHSAFVLFLIFTKIVETGEVNGFDIVVQFGWLAGGGALWGILMSLITNTWLKVRSAH